MTTHLTSLNNWAELKASAPAVGLVLGSGLGSVVQSMGYKDELPFAKVAGLSASTVPGHAGRFLLSEVGQHSLLIAQGRCHLYEGRTALEVTATVRLMQDAGVETIILTNAAGALNLSHRVGSLMLINDHLNLTGTSPLLGGPNFVDMSCVYSQDLRERMLRAARSLDLLLFEGVYAGLLGPQYETPAEIRMLRTLGADAVGMSTVLEAIQARALGMRVVGISTLTNWAAGIESAALSHHDVMTVGQAASVQLAALLKAFLADLPPKA